MASQRLVPLVPHKSLDRSHAPFTPAAARPVAKSPAGSSQEMETLLVSTTNPWFTTRHRKLHLRSSLRPSPARGRASTLRPQRSPPRLLTAAAWSGLEPALGNRLRRANLHLSCSYRAATAHFRCSSARAPTAGPSWPRSAWIRARGRPDDCSCRPGCAKPRSRPTAAAPRRPAPRSDACGQAAARPRPRCAARCGHRIEQAEGVVAGDAMLQGQETTQQGFLGGAEFGHLRAVLCPAQARRQGNHQEFRQIVLGRAVARITHVDPADPKRLHEALPFKPPDISGDIPESISYSSTSRSLLMCDSPAAQGGVAQFG